MTVLYAHFKAVQAATPQGPLLRIQAARVKELSDEEEDSFTSMLVVGVQYTNRAGTDRSPWFYFYEATDYRSGERSVIMSKTLPPHEVLAQSPVVEGIELSDIQSATREELRASSTAIYQQLLEAVEA